MKKDKYNEEKIDKFHLGNVISAHECTGLIQVPPQTPEEQENYMDLVDYKAPEVKKKKK